MKAGSVLAIARFRDMESISTLPDDERDRLAHISLPIGESVLIGSDTLPSYTSFPSNRLRNVMQSNIKE